MKTNRNTRGFTLLETAIALALSATASVVAINAWHSADQTTSAAQALAWVDQTQAAIKAAYATRPNFMGLVDQTAQAYFPADSKVTGSAINPWGGELAATQTGDESNAF